MRASAVVFLAIARPVTCAPGASPGEVGSGASSDAWILSGSGRGAYTLGLDPEVRLHQRATTALSPAGATDGAYGAAVVAFPAAPFVGERLRITVPVRTEGVTGRGDVWVRVRGRASPTDGPYLDEGRRTLPATADFALQPIEVDVPWGASEVRVGAGIGGPGRLWVGEATWEVLPEVAPTDSPIGTWNVTWDRSASGAQPPVLHGTLVVAEGTVGMDWAEDGSGDPLLRSLVVDGAQIRILLGSVDEPDGRTLLQATVDGERLRGTASADGPGGQVPPSPLLGRRVPVLPVAP